MDWWRGEGLEGCDVTERCGGMWLQKRVQGVVRRTDCVEVHENTAGWRRK